MRDVVYLLRHTPWCCRVSVCEASPSLRREHQNQTAAQTELHTHTRTRTHTDTLRHRCPYVVTLKSILKGKYLSNRALVQVERLQRLGETGKT